MGHFKALFVLLLKRFFSRRNIFLLLVLLVLSIYGTQQGIKERKQILNNREEFKKLESTLFNKIRNYSKYSSDGFKIFLIPGSPSVFFSNPVFLSELSARINSITILDIGSNCKGGLILRGNSPFTQRFDNVVRVLASLLILFLGFEIMRKKEFLRSLSSQWCKFGVFITISFSVTILFILCLLVIFACCIGLTVLQGILLTTADIKGLLISLPPMILKLLFFFFFGAILGSIRSKYTGIPGLLAVWIIFIFIYPAVVNSYIENKSHEITSAYKADSGKLSIMTNFEKRAEKVDGKYKDNTDEGRRKVAEKFWEKDRKEIEAVDERLKQEISQLIDEYNTLSLFTPTTFYTNTCDEVSSRGYQSYLDFFTYLQDLRSKFVRFWIERVYYHDQEVLVNFVTNDENLFYSKSRVPKKYWTGVFFNLGIVILLAAISYLLFKRSLEHVSAKEIKELGKVDLDLDKGELKIWLTQKEHFKKVLFNMFSGISAGLFKKGFKGELYFDGADTADGKFKNNFVYICHADELPGDIKVIDLLTFYVGWNQLPATELEKHLNNEELGKILKKPISELEKHEKFEVSMGLLNMSKSDIYFINNIASGMPMTCSVKLLNKMEELQSNALVIFLITPGEVNMSSIPGGGYFEEDDIWINLVKSAKRVIEMSIKEK
jgi:ABC-type transport system involved in cytochrome c biogenesis ATPase subunit